MAKDKKSFVLYADLLPMVSKIPDETAGKLFKHILEYVNDLDPEEPDDLLISIAFEPIKQQLKRDLKKYEAVIERNKTNGSRGGRPKNNPDNPVGSLGTQNNPDNPSGSFGNPLEPKKPDTVTGTVTGSGTVTGTGTVNDTKKPLVPVPVKNDPPRPKKIPQKKESPTSETWESYSYAYHDRYNVMPVRNATVNSQLSNFVKRIGKDESPYVAAFFVGHNNQFYVSRGHAIGNLLADAEKLRTEWATNQTMTQTQARQTDRKQSTGNVFNKLIEEVSAHENN